MAMTGALWMSCIGVVAWWLAEEADETWQNIILVLIGLALLTAGVWLCWVFDKGAE